MIGRVRSVVLGKTMWQIKSNQMVHLISMYHPCKSDRPTTTYQQHIHSLAKLQQDKCSQQVILVDLAQGIKTWQVEGENIILFMDMDEDEDVQIPRLKAYLMDLGLTEVLTALHSHQVSASHPLFQTFSILIICAIFLKGDFHIWQRSPEQ